MDEELSDIDLFTLAASQGDCDTIRQMVANGCDIEAMDEGGFSPLRCAILDYQAEAVRVMLELGADPNARDISTNGFSPLDDAISLTARNRMPERIEIVTLLLSYGADPTVRTWMDVNAIEQVTRSRPKQVAIYQLVINHKRA